MRAQAIPEPLVVQRAKGDRIWDVEDRELIDLNMGYGPHLFGYADPELAAALARQLTEGAMTGLPHRLDQQAGELIARLVPSVEQVRFANSGTEAVASALRLARAATGRTLVLTFDGHYHGWSETVLRAGKATFHEPAPDSTAAAAGRAGHDPGGARPHAGGALERPARPARRVRGPRRTARGGDLRTGDGQRLRRAAGPGQLEELRALCDRWGAWLIFDEVITGFRVGRGGAQEHYGVMPDLTVLSKVMGGGVPVAAFGGSRETMAMLADQRALHLGVYAGNHMSVRAVVTMLEKIERSPEIYEQLEKHCGYLEDQLRSMFAEMNRQALVSRVGRCCRCRCCAGPLTCHAARARPSRRWISPPIARCRSGAGKWRVLPSQPDRTLVSQHRAQPRRSRSRGRRSCATRWQTCPRHGERRQRPRAAPAAAGDGRTIAGGRGLR